jgi:hypothetical protein
MACALDRGEAAARARLAALAPAVADIAIRYEADLERLVLYRRLDEHASNPDIGPLDDPGALAGLAGPGAPADALSSISEDDRETLLHLRRAWFSAVGLQLVRRRDLAFADHLRRLKDRRLGSSAAPSRAEREKAIAAAAMKVHASEGPL